MKISKTKLQQIIKEEFETLLEAAVNENPNVALPDGGTLVGPADPSSADPHAGGTLVGPADTPKAAAAGNKKLALVAKELQILLKKIQQEL